MKILAHPKLPKSSNHGPFVFIGLFVILVSHISFGQTDPQWYVLHGNGRSGYSTEYQYNNPIDSNFTIQGITHPNRGCDKLAKNEIFIIYRDGSHFNSREQANSANIYPIDFFYPKIPNSTVLDTTIHHFQTIGNKSVRYLYKTSIYEGDEPPRTIQVNNASGTPGRDTIYKPGTTNTTSILSATHDVVKNKDITLIVNYAQLIKIYGSAPNSMYYLQYDKVQSRGAGTGVSSHHEFFKLEPVFKDFVTDLSALPANGVVKIANKAKLWLRNTGSDYIYINLHPTAHLTTFYPNTPAGTVRYDALFEIYKETRIDDDETTSEKLLSHLEQIRLSHDPNKMAVQSICIKGDKTYICYRVEFTNTSFTPAQNIEVEMDFPDDFQDKCIAISSWKIGGQEVPGGQIELCEGKIKAIFPPDLTLVNCQSGQNRDLCGGSLDFCIKVNTQEDVRNLEYNVEPTVNIYFDGIPYPLEHFIDPFTQDTSLSGFALMRPQPVTDCETHCNFYCYPCQPCIIYPIPTVLIVLSVFTLSWMFYRRLRLKAVKRTSN